MTPGILFLFRFFKQLPSLDLSTLMGFLSSHIAPQGPSTSTRSLLQELQKQELCHVRHVRAGGPRHRQEYRTQTLIVGLLKIHLLLSITELGGPLANPERMCGILKQAGDMLCSRKINFVVE